MTRENTLGLWRLLLTALSVLALVNTNVFAVYLVAVLIPLCPTDLGSPKKRLFLIFLSIIIIAAGPYSLIFTVPLALMFSRTAVQGWICAALLFFIGINYPLLQSLPTSWPSKIPIASFSFVLIASWVTAFIFCSTISRKALLILITTPAIISFVIYFSAGIWFNTDQFTDPLFQLVASIIPILIVARYSKVNESTVPTIKKTLLPFIAGAFLVAFIPIEKLSEIVFDESHGRWETVKSSFTPEDFGRSANYTYSELFSKASLLVGNSSTLDNEADSLPSTSSLLILKMPTKPFGDDFINRVVEWVYRGGRLLVVADHTDLYNTTQNSNSLLLQHFGIKINSDATYNPRGMPTSSIVKTAGIMFGRIDAHGNKVEWQTGASLGLMPLMSLELMNYGASFSEQGDYSRANRFGPFLPEISKRFFPHSASIATPHGNGVVAVILDSTPWSNFSIFKEEYTHMFVSLVSALEHPYQLYVIKISSFFLAVLACLLLIRPSGFLIVLLSIILGMAISAGVKIGTASILPLIEGREYSLKVVSGDSAKLEFLKQLLLPGERNYSRIVSSLGKYSLMPVASLPGAMPSKLSSAKNWLFIEPSPEQLPNYQDLFSHLKNKRNITILFSPSQATNPDILKWLQEWGVFTKRSIGLSISDGITGSKGSILGKRGLILGRELDIVTISGSSSILNRYDGNQLLQSYSLRPTTFPRTSGLLTLSFSSDQFTDDTVGEVWEGIYPSSIGRQREQLLSSAILGKRFPELMPKSIVLSQQQTINLPAFAALEDGKKKISGQFGIPGDDDSVTTYFRSLRNQAGGFILANCPATGATTQCEKRLLGNDMVEWLVSWRSSGDGDIAAIELLHERRMSGLGSTWNVLFGNK